jgi:hypothetical protein
LLFSFIIALADVCLEPPPAALSPLSDFPHPSVNMYQFHQDQTTYTILQAEKKLKSKSWVMTTPGSEGFIKLPNEQILYTSPLRTSIQLSTPNTYPAANPYSAKSDSGIVYVTNQRVNHYVSNNELIC